MIIGDEQLLPLIVLSAMTWGLSIIREFTHTVFQHRTIWATSLAVLFHVTGLIGIRWVDERWFTMLTPLNLILMFFLLLWTETRWTKNYFLYFAIAFSAGMITEIIGVHTGWLFGDYSYGTVLGPRLAAVPLLIGINWFVVTYAARTIALEMLSFLSRHTVLASVFRIPNMHRISLVLLGAALATAYDWIMEPVAVRLGFWTWNRGDIPAFNYYCWFALSVLLLLFPLRSLSNRFAIHLFVIQALFFLFLRLLL